MKIIYYAIAYHWVENDEDSPLGFYTSHNGEIFRGTKKDAKAQLKFIEHNNRSRKYFVVRLKMEKLK